MCIIDYFCDIPFRHRAVLPTCPKTDLKIENLVTLGSTRMIYCIFNNFFKVTFKFYKINDIHFIDLSGTCLFMVHFGLFSQLEVQVLEIYQP